MCWCVVCWWCAAIFRRFHARAVCNLVQIRPTRRISIAVVHVGWGQWVQRGYCSPPPPPIGQTVTLGGYKEGGGLC